MTRPTPSGAQVPQEPQETSGQLKPQPQTPLRRKRTRTTREEEDWGLPEVERYEEVSGSSPFACGIRRRVGVWSCARSNTWFYHYRRRSSLASACLFVHFTVSASLA